VVSRHRHRRHQRGMPVQCLSAQRYPRQTEMSAVPSSLLRLCRQMWSPRQVHSDYQTAQTKDLHDLHQCLVTVLALLVLVLPLVVLEQVLRLPYVEATASHRQCRRRASLLAQLLALQPRAPALALLLPVLQLCSAVAISNPGRHSRKVGWKALQAQLCVLQLALSFGAAVAIHRRHRRANS